MVNFNIIINILSLAQVFCLDKVGLIPLLRKLTRANQSLDREALWEAAETFHRLHQVLNSIKSPLCPPSPCSGGVVRTWWRWWSVWTFFGFNRTQPCTPQSDQAESPCKYFFLKKDSLQYLLSLSGGDLPSIGGSSPPFLAAIAETLATPVSFGRRQDCRQVRC